ncbi:MFS transporter [Vulcanisaeta thermophila]|uniref:MFS transporter n=1 Tax=Vulcanisaeta thermophila TaxID=867917 RepID=UPI00085345D3|nr:MFS transporter [Vulcanisaeta thermophila]
MKRNLIRHYIRGNAGVLLITWLLFNTTYALSFAYIPTYIKMTGGNTYDVGLTYALGTLALALTLPLGGYLTDRLGRRFVINLCTWIIAILTFPFIYAPAWYYITIYYVLNMFFSFHQPALMAILADSLPRDRVVSGFLFTSILPTLPMVVLMPVGGLIISTYGLTGFKLAFLISGILAVVAAVIRTIYIRETMTTGNAATVITLTEAYRSLIITMRGISGRVRSLLLSALLISMAASPMTSIAQVYGIYVMNLSPTQWGELMSLALIITIALTSYLSLRPRLNEDRLIMLLITSSIAVNAIALIPGPTPFIIYAVAYQVTNTIVLTALQGMITKSVPMEVRGRMSSAYIMLQLLGQSLGNYLIASLYGFNKTVLFIIPLTILMVNLIVIRERFNP